MGLAVSAPAGAFNVDYEVGVAAKRSDNINLSEADPIHDTVLSPRIYFEAEQDGPRLQMSAHGDLQYLHYASDTFDDETRGRLAARANWSLSPQRVDLVVQDYLSLQPVDQLTAFSPGNQQQVNVFVAGPTFHARFGPATRGQLDLRYINSYAEETETFDSDRYTAAARIARELEPGQTVSANLEATDVQFDLRGGASDYRRYDAYLSSTVDRRLVDLSADLGYSRIELDASGDDSYLLARATLDWHLSPRNLLGVNVRHQLSDSTESLMAPLEFQRRPFNDFEVPDGLVEPSAFKERMVRVRYLFNGERLQTQLTPYYRRIRYLDDAVEDQDRRGVLLTGDYRLRPRMTLHFHASRQRREFVDIAREDKDLAAGLGLSNRFTRHWTGRIDYQYRERDSTQPGRSFEENAVMASFSFQR